MFKSLRAWARRDFERGRARNQSLTERERLRCARCRHDLTGLTINVCPECGAPMSLRDSVWTDGRWRLEWLLASAAALATLVVGVHIAGGFCIGRYESLIRAGFGPSSSAYLEAGVALRFAARIMLYFAPLLMLAAAWGVVYRRHAMIRLAVVGSVAIVLPWIIAEVLWYFTGGTISVWP